MRPEVPSKVLPVFKTWKKKKKNPNPRRSYLLVIVAIRPNDKPSKSTYGRSSYSKILSGTFLAEAIH